MATADFIASGHGDSSASKAVTVDSVATLFLS